MNQSHESNNPRDQRLDAYLDGAMDDAQRAAFERGLADDADLRRQVELQGRVDDALRRAYDTSNLVAPPPPPEAARDAAGSFAFRLRPILLAAALLALTAAGVWSFFTLSTAGRGPRPEPLAQEYRQQIADGFTPGWVCETDREFADTFAQRFQQPLLLADAAGLEALGLTYNYALGPRTVMLLARVDGEPVIVFVGPSRLIEHEPRAGGRGLSLFDRTVGGVTLYELSPLEGPRVLDHFFIPTEADLPPTPQVNPTPQESMKPPAATPAAE